jgi:hypothetical protein
MEGTLESKRQAFDVGLLKLLTCPICMRYYSNYITMCEQGHSLCSECFQKILDNSFSSPTCPTCRCYFVPSPRRNEAAESLLVGLKIPCKYTSLGCDQQQLDLATRNAHEADCQFDREVSCPYIEVSDDASQVVIECSWVGHFNTLIPHLCGVHHLQTEVYSGSPRLTFDDVDLSFYRNYLKFKLVYLQDSGLTLLVKLGNVPYNHDIVVTCLEYNKHPRAVTLLVESRVNSLTYTRSIYGMQMSHYQGSAVFTFSKRDFKTLCTGRAFSLTLTITVSLFCLLKLNSDRQSA